MPGGDRLIGAGIAEAWYGASGVFASYLTPTSAECNSLTSLSSFIPDGGVNTPSTGQTTGVANLTAAFQPMIASVYGGDTAEVTCYRSGTADTAYDILTDFEDGFLVVVRRPLAAYGVFAAADEVDVYPVQIITKNPAPIGHGDAQRFTAPMAVRLPPNLKYALAT